MLMGVFGNVSMDELESDTTDAEFKARSTSLLAREAALVDRYAAAHLVNLYCRI